MICYSTNRNLLTTRSSERERRAVALLRAKEIFAIRGIHFSDFKALAVEYQVNGTLLYQEFVEGME